MPPAKIITTTQKERQFVEKFLRHWSDFNQTIIEFVTNPRCPLFLQGSFRVLSKNGLSVRFLKELRQHLGGQDLDLDQHLNLLESDWLQLKKIATTNKTGLLAQFYKYFWNIAYDEVLIWDFLLTLHQFKQSSQHQLFSPQNQKTPQPQIPTKLALSSQITVHFNTSYDIKQISRLLDPLTWSNRLWQARHSYQLPSPHNPPQLGLLTSPTLEHLSQIILIDPAQYSSAKQLFTNSQKLATEFSTRRSIFKLDFQKPLCQIFFTHRDQPLTVYDSGSLHGIWGNLTQLSASQYWQSIRQTLDFLTDRPQLWQKDFDRLKNQIRKPQLALRNFLPAQAIVLRREAELFFRSQLCHAHFYPLAQAPLPEPYYLLQLTQTASGQIQFALNGQNAGQLIPLTTQKSQLLAFDDLRLWEKKLLQQEFSLITSSPLSFLTPLQKEIYLALLIDRRELDQKWLWTDED